MSIEKLLENYSVLLEHFFVSLFSVTIRFFFSGKRNMFFFIFVRS